MKIRRICLSLNTCTIVILSFLSLILDSNIPVPKSSIPGPNHDSMHSYSEMNPFKLSPCQAEIAWPPNHQKGCHSLDNWPLSNHNKAPFTHTGSVLISHTDIYLPTDPNSLGIYQSQALLVNLNTILAWIHLNFLQPWAQAGGPLIDIAASKGTTWAWDAGWISKLPGKGAHWGQPICDPSF